MESRNESISREMTRKVLLVTDDKADGKKKQEDSV